MVPMMKTDDINDQAITKDKIRDGNVTTEKLAEGSVSTDKLPDGAIKTEKIADENVTTSKLAEASVVTSKIADQNVTKEKIADQSVDNSKLSPEAVTYDKLKDKSIITEKLNDRAVTTEKVEEKAITNTKLGDQSVDGRVVREASLETKHFSNESVTTEKVARKSITKDKLADNAVDASQVVDGSIGNAKLSPDSVTTEKIKDGSVTNEKVADDTIGIEKFDPELRKTIQAATGLPEDLNQMIQDVDQSVKQLHEKDTDLQSQIDDKQQQITANDDDISLLQTRSTQMEEAIKGISASGGASQASAVTYENTESGLDSVTAQGAIDELASKKFNKENIAQEFGNSNDKVVSQFALPFREIESPEFIKAIVDAEDKVLFGFYRATGKPYYPLNEMYHVIQNDEYFAAWLDAEDKLVLGIRRDGEIIGEIHAVNALKQVVSQLQSDLASLQEKVGTIDTNLKELLDVFSLQETPEYLAVEQDAEGKVLASTNADGSKHYNTSIYPSNVVFPDRTIDSKEIEDYKELLLDADNKILRYTDKNDVIHENRHCIIKNLDFETSNSMAAYSTTPSRSLNLPKYGYTNIKEETFYLTANSGYSDKDGILAMLVNADTEENAKKGLTLYKYYVKSTLQNTDGIYSIKEDSVALNFYVPSDVKEVDGKSYVTASLTKGNDGNYSVNSNSIEVTKIIDKPNIGTWAVDKKVKHWCVVDIDFGSFLKGTYNVLVSFQGASTLYVREKNFRYAFVEHDYKKKIKLKIGELLRLDKFNLKSYYYDDTKIKEPLIFRLYLQAKELKNFNEQYPWSKSAKIQTGATGIIKSFPVCTSVGGEFYGIQFFGYKKDKANYMLSSDKDGMILSGGDGCSWAKFDWSKWEDEMNDTPTESNKTAVESLYQFINGNNFTKDTVPKHMNVYDWIDYFIFIQVFRMRDNDIHNLILYSGKDKTIFSPFLYDLDLSFDRYSFNVEYYKSNTVWLKLKSVYWDEICKRYAELRKSVLNIGNFNMVAADLQSNIDYTDFTKGIEKWGVRRNELTTGYLSDLFSKLLNEFDVYFNFK